MAGRVSALTVAPHPKELQGSQFGMLSSLHSLSISHKVILNGAASSEFGRAAIASLASARGLFLAGVCDADAAVRGMDAGEVRARRGTSVRM